MATWMSCAAAFVSDSSQSAICARPAPLCSKIRCPTISSLSPVSTTSCLSLAQSTPANHCRRLVSVIWLLPPFLAKPSRSLSVPVLALEGAVFPLDIDRYQFAGARLRKRCSKHGDDVVTPGESARLWKTTPVGARVAGHASFRCASLRMTCDDAVFPKPHSNGTGMTGGAAPLDAGTGGVYLADRLFNREVLFHVLGSSQRHVRGPR